METYVCKFSSTRHFIVYEVRKENKSIIDYIDQLYIDMMSELGFGTRTGGNDEYYIKKVKESEQRSKFEHHIEAACISRFSDTFDFLYGSKRTIEADKHAVQLISIGRFPYVDWEVKIVSYSHLYTIRERLPSVGIWENLKGESGNTLISAYPNEQKSKYKKITFHSKLIEVEIVH